MNTTALIGNRPSSIWLRLSQNRVVFMVGAILILTLVAGLFFDNFVTVPNFNTIIFNISIDTIIGIGVMVMLIAGVFDLSIGSIVGFSGAITAYMIVKADMTPLMASIIAIISAAGIGYFNGFLVARVGVNHLIVGLVMMGVIRGVNLLITGAGITGLSNGFFQFTNISFLGFRLPVWYMAILCILFMFFLNKTHFFRRFYFLGGNEKAARLSGINVNLMKITVFTISGGLAGLGGVMMASKFSGAIPSLGQGLEMKLITACVLGGASITGGYGNIQGLITGVLFMGVITNFMVVAVVPVSWQGIIISGILLIAVTIDAVMNRNRIN